MSRLNAVRFVQRALLGAPQERLLVVMTTALRRCARLSGSDRPRERLAALRVLYAVAVAEVASQPEWYFHRAVLRATRTVMARSGTLNLGEDDRFARLSLLQRALVTLRASGHHVDEQAFVVDVDRATVERELATADERLKPEHDLAYSGAFEVVCALLRAGSACPLAQLQAFLHGDRSGELGREPELHKLLVALRDLIGTYPESSKFRRDGSEVMISYNWKDQRTVDHLPPALEREGIRAWMDRERPGVHLKSVYRVLSEVLATADAFVVVRGPHGPGDFQIHELDAILHQERVRKVPVVVVVPETVIGDPPALHPFYDSRMFIDLRVGSLSAGAQKIAEALAAVRRTAQ